jgi:long-chain fatty acid transport protein
MLRSDNFQRPLSFHRRAARLAPGLLALVLLAAGTTARGDGVVRDSIGPVSSGRGGTNIAFSDNLALINDNPAGLVRVGGLRFDLGVDLLKADISYRDPQNPDGRAKDQIFPLPEAAVGWRVLEGPVGVSVGFGLFVPAGYGAEYRLNHPVYGEQKYLSQAGLYKFLTTLSLDLGHGFTAGVGAGLAYERVDFETPYTFQTGALAGVPALIKLKSDGVAPAWNVGLQYQISQRWTVGLAYIAETSVNLKGKFDVDVTGVVPVPNPTARYDVEAENTWPRSLGLGTAYRFDRGSLSLDLLWFDWSSAFDALTFRLKNGNNPTFDMLAGTTRPRDRFPLEWHDSYTVRLGGELNVTPLDVVRAGYIYITNPVPDRTLTPLIPAILQHAFSVGYGHRFGPVNVDLAYQFSFGPRQHVGSSEIIGGDFDQSSVFAMAHWLFLGASLSF